MRERSIYLSFLDISPDFKRRTTKTYLVHSARTGAELGTIYWHGKWRSYVFEPAGGTIFSPGCLGGITEFLDSLITEWKIKMAQRGARR